MGKGRRWGRSHFRTWYVAKDLLAIVGGAVVLHRAYEFVQLYLRGPSVF